MRRSYGSTHAFFCLCFFSFELPTKLSTIQGMYPNALNTLNNNETQYKTPQAIAIPLLFSIHASQFRSSAINETIRKGSCKTSPMLVPISCPICSHSSPVSTGCNKSEKLLHTIANHTTAIIAPTNNALLRFFFLFSVMTHSSPLSESQCDRFTGRQRVIRLSVIYIQNHRHFVNFLDAINPIL